MESTILEANYALLQQTVQDLKPSLPHLRACTQILVEVLRAGNKILTAGNGGSAADALHLSEELVGRYQKNRRAFPALALVADGTALTCIGNDFGFDHIFSRQVEALGQPGDALILFTTSGNSANLLLALDVAQARGLRTVVFSGRGGGKLSGRAEAEWIVPSTLGARVQEMHGWALHVVLEIVENELVF